MQMRVLAVATVFGCAALLTPWAHAQGIPVRYQVVAREGEPAPGTAPGLTFRVLEAPTIGPTGAIVFGADLRGPGVTNANDSAFFAGTRGAMGVVARSGAPAPGTDTTYGPETPFWFTTPPINGANQIVFNAPLTRAISGAEGMFVGSPGAVTLLGQSGDAAPDAAPGVRFAPSRPFGRSALNESGWVAFRAALAGPGAADTSTGIFAGAPGAIRLAARTGSPAAGAGGAEYFRISGDLAMNETGAVVFGAQLAGTGVSSANNQGLWLGRPGAMELAVRKGSPAPGTAGTFAHFFADLVPPAPALNDNNQIAFSAAVRDGQGAEAHGIWAGTPSSMSLVALQGQPAPGTGLNFLSIDSQPAINNRGEVAFRAIVPGGAFSFRRGIWAGMPGALKLVALEGSPMPLEPGAPTAHFTDVSGPFILNNAGQVAFNAFVAFDGNSNHLTSLWATDPSGELRLIAREGAQLDLGGGELRTITYLKLFAAEATGTGTGRGVAFNDAGQLAFLARWDRAGPDGPRDGAIFIATVVPEPGAAGTAIGAAGICLLRGRRRTKPQRNRCSGGGSL